MPFLRFLFAWRTRRRFVALALASVVFSGCGGGGASLAPSGVGTTLLDGTVRQAGTVALPVGSHIVPSRLHVVNSLGSAGVTSNGAFAVDAFSTDVQFAMVTGATGAPLMLGFVGTGHTQVNPATTAAVMLYFATYLYTVPNPQRDEAFASLATLPGIDTVEAAISAAIVAHPTQDVLANSAVVASIGTLVTAIQGSSAMKLPAAAGIVQVRAMVGRRPQDIAIAPGKIVSGIRIVPDFPDGIHFQNTYRRAAQAFVDEVSHVPVGATQAVNDQAPDTNAPVDIASAVGLNGLIGTISDLLDGNAAGTPTDTATIPTPNLSGAAKTTYRVMIVGPGAHAGNASSMTSVEARAQVATSTSFLFTDLLLPFIVSIALPTSSLDKATAAGVVDAFKSVISNVAANPHFSALAASGDAKGVVLEGISLIASDGVLQSNLINAIFTVFGARSTSGTQAATRLSTFFGKFTTLGDLAITAIDKAFLIANVLQSDQADLYTITAIPDKIGLTPATSTISNYDIVSLTTTVPNTLQLPAGETLQYAYTNTAKDGHLSDGNPSHVDTFTSNDANVVYSANGSGTGTDTITVTATEVSGGVTKTTLGTATATIAVSANGLTLTSPQTIQNGATAALTATYTSVGSPPPGTIAYEWSNTGSVGTITDPVSGKQNTFTTSATTVDYVASASGSGQDTIDVQAILTNGAKTTVLDSAKTTVTVSQTTVVLNPHTQNVANTGTGTVNAVLVTGNGNPPPGTARYTWTTTGAYGHLTDPDTGGTSDAFTTASAGVTYTANASGMGSDAVNVSVALTNGSQVQTLVPKSAATIVVGPAPSPTPASYAIAISPPCAQIAPNSSATFTVTASGPALPVGAVFAYGWPTDTTAGSGGFTFTVPSVFATQPSQQVSTSATATASFVPPYSGYSNSFGFLVYLYKYQNGVLSSLNQARTEGFISVGLASCP